MLTLAKEQCGIYNENDNDNLDTAEHLCPEMHADTNFPNLTIFRYHALGLGIRIWDFKTFIHTPYSMV